MSAIPSRFRVPARILMGPGPSTVSPRVIEAMGRPVVGHMDPACLQMYDEIRWMLQEVFRTSNQLTYPVSGTGTAAMETAMVNLLAPGDTALILVSGMFAERMREIGLRAGASMVTVGGAWGSPIDPPDVEAALAANPSTKAVCAVHGETSTGVLQPLREIGALCRERGVLFVADCVATLGGTEVDTDGWSIDVCYSGSQKCLSAPPGLGPISFSEPALRARREREAPPATFYLDALLIGRYMVGERLYHHTAPVSMLYAMHEALRLVLDEGLEARWRRHDEIGAEVLAGLEQRGFGPVPPEGFRMPMLAVVEVPAGLPEREARARLLHEFGIEIGGGLGEWAGRVWRIGTMGESANRDHVKALFEALDQILP